MLETFPIDFYTDITVRRGAFPSRWVWYFISHRCYVSSINLFFKTVWRYTVGSLCNALLLPGTQNVTKIRSGPHCHPNVPVRNPMKDTDRKIHYNCKLFVITTRHPLKDILCGTAWDHENMSTRYVVALMCFYVMELTRTELRWYFLLSCDSEHSPLRHKHSDIYCSMDLHCTQPLKGITYKLLISYLHTEHLNLFTMR